MYFPSVYDIKYLMKFCDNLHGGLNKLAECLDVNRIGPQHQVPTQTHPPSPLGVTQRLLSAPVRISASGAARLMCYILILARRLSRLLFRHILRSARRATGYPLRSCLGGVASSSA